MNQYKHMTAAVQWDGFLIEYIAIRNGEERIKFTMGNAVCLGGQFLVTLFEKLCRFYVPFISAMIDAPGESLVLTDINNNELHLNGCTCGSGPGDEATFIILNSNGFKVSRTLINKSRSFYLEKPYKNFNYA
jgi:hypothetical protein